MIKAIIIDDEPLARTRLRRLLGDFKERLTVIAEASNGQEGLELIESLKPDLIFLDIEMPVMNGFDMMRTLKREVAIIFVTAYDQFAIKAFEENAVDYLLKPVEKERLAKSIMRVQQNHQSSLQSLQDYLANIPQTSKQAINSLTVKIGDRILIVKTETLSYLVAEDKYVFLYQQDGNKHLTDYTLSGLEEKLSNDFLRIHRSIILNKQHIQEIRKGFNGSFTFIMDDPHQTKLKSSRSYYNDIRNTLDF